ncbi:hypothetical protein BDZ94DRAFT_1272931 [Collybia nuda]|uniref:Uncharacterized protein n=1 Tax=Collybia nuda TaxID=64659 RepID=A0A9P5XVL6_9AGAR|nr:hypothetical protein BDZ94DRAFT_1272931 [Collybia nuda]
MYQHVNYWCQVPMQRCCGRPNCAMYPIVLYLSHHASSFHSLPCDSHVCWSTHVQGISERLFKIGGF